MIIKKDVSIAKYTTFRIGGVTPCLYIPEEKEELCDLLKDLTKKQEKFFILGNGSNVLIKDGNLDFSIIVNTKVADFYKQEEGYVEVGSSLDLRKFVTLLHKDGLRSFAGFMTIPGTIGGAIVMNAGRNSYKDCISDHLLSVKYFDGKKICEIKKDDCHFSYRYSIFQKNYDWYILSATFKIPKEDSNISQKNIQKSLEDGRDKIYRKYYSAGSVFKVFSHKIVKFLSGIRIGDAYIPKENINTIVNKGKAKYWQVRFLLFFVVFLHKILFQKIELEIKIVK